MTLLVLDALETAPLVSPLREGWLASELPFELRSTVTAEDVGPDDAALLASAEAPLLAETHLVVPGAAVVCIGAGSIAMRTPVRPDEIERSDVRLYGATSTAELLARATLEPFYGIVPLRFLTDEAPHAQVVVVEGAGALVPPEGGFSEDLVRAWFILTGQPVVTHVVVVPKAAPSSLGALVEQLREVGHERRRDVRVLAGERFGIDRGVLAELAPTRRYALTAEDRRALLVLLQRGHRGSAQPYTWRLGFVGDPVVDDAPGP